MKQIYTLLLILYFHLVGKKNKKERKKKKNFFVYLSFSKIHILHNKEVTLTLASIERSKDII